MKKGFLQLKNRMREIKFDLDVAIVSNITGYSKEFVAHAFRKGAELRQQ